MTAPAYQCNGRIALQRARGLWEIFTTRGFDPVRFTWREWVAAHPPIATATNRGAAIAEVKR